MMSHTNGHSDIAPPQAHPPTHRADEVAEVLSAVQDLLVPFIRAADTDAGAKSLGHGLAVDGGAPRTTLVEPHPPQKLVPLLALDTPQEGKGKDGMVSVLERILRYSVNTWDQGFMDKLYASTNAVGVASELILAVLNTNVHVYQVSPALTLIEKHTTRSLAALFGFTGPHAGGISQPGGSASNSTSIIIARNTLYPHTKSEGIGNLRFVLFTSAHGHYSVEKAAQMFGFGSKAVRSVPVDEYGQMRPDALDAMIEEAKNKGETPFYVNATAGTTVLGSYDPFERISDVCRKHNLWLHIDGSWGGSVIFSAHLSSSRLRGCERADSIAVNPHKMLGVPVTCSFLLAKDLRQFHKASTLPAGYLFHNNDDDGGDVWDLADLTPQCGRRGDALKMYLAWEYYGTSGLAERVENAFSVADHLYTILEGHPHIVLVSRRPLPCLQVCFHWAKNRELGSDHGENSEVTRRVVEGLVRRGFMIDFAPGEKGKFFRVVVSISTRRETVEGLVRGIEGVAGELGY